MPRGFVIDSPRCAQRPLVYPYANGSLGMEVVYIHIGVGLRLLLVSTCKAIS